MALPPPSDRLGPCPVPFRSGPGTSITHLPATPALSHQPPRPQAVAQERPCPRSPAASPTTSPRQCSCRGLALTLLARVQQVLLQVAPEHPLLRAALLLSFLPGLHGWGRGALAQPPTPKSFALPVPHGIPSWPPGLARPQGGGGPGSRQRLLPLEPWPHGSGRGRGSCQDPGKKLRLVARTGTRPARPTQPWGGGRKLCSSSNLLPVRASLQPQGLGWGRQQHSLTPCCDLAHWPRGGDVRALGWPLVWGVSCLPPRRPGRWGPG